jgi:hypothetical protein
MNAPRCTALAILLSLSGAWPPVRAQVAPARPDTFPVPPLFQSATPLAVTFTADLDRLKADKDTNAPWHGATLTYTSDSGRITVPARARTRGIWRLKHCTFPPLRLDFPGRNEKGTLFQHLGKPKLVNFCRDTDPYDQYILQEFQLYRVYQLLTPVSYRVRLLRMAYLDSGSTRPEAVRYAFIAEDPERLAQRVNGTVIKAKGATASDLEAEPLALAYLFQFLIGNTDFSFNGLHNTQIIGTMDGRMLPVAYDFDYAGAVNATYATPDPSLRTRTVRERKFRGYCALADVYPRLLPLFREKKDAIYALYSDEIGRLMDAGRIRETLSYFDEFYDMISTPEKAQREFLSDCVKSPR